MTGGKVGLVTVTFLINALFFVGGPVLGAVAAPFSLGIAASVLRESYKIAGALYMLMFSVLLFFLSPIAGVIAVFASLSAGFRLVVKG